MPPVQKFPIQKLIRYDEDLAARIEQWRRSQKVIPTETEAIRQLIDAGLVAEGIA